MTLIATDSGMQLEADPARVVAKLFLPGESIAPVQIRAEAIYERVLALDDATAAATAKSILDTFSPRHDDLPGILADHAKAGLARVGGTIDDQSPHFTVLGGTFTAEYAVEGAALCNPSPVLHPDQTGLKPGEARIALAVREIGEGHVSTLGFACATVGAGGWAFEERALPLRAPVVKRANDSWSNYEIVFAEDSSLSQRVAMPVIDSERNGIEDARFVRFTGADGHTDYRATYTAYDGTGVLPRLFVSEDLVSFSSHPLTGAAATNKGVALFPRPVGGEILALVRSDGESNFVARSPDGLAWGHGAIIRTPEMPWEIVTTGNCGSPIETSEGWLVMTHGVGAMRVYSMGAMLLDLDDPTKVIGLLREPLLRSDGTKQNGYVPNVVYSCGSIVHEGTVWIPYGVGDNRIRVASVGLDELLAAMR